MITNNLKVEQGNDLFDFLFYLPFRVIENYPNPLFCNSGVRIVPVWWR